ncbi:MAG: VanZ family protein [Atopobiaceae bacterium]|nr:VanZ family protein [Atopobiaceae bacterium]
MNNPKRAAIVRTVALLLWIGFIWTHSMESGAESDETSLFFVDWFEPLFTFLGIEGVALQNHVIRKIAHFTEYFILGILAHGSIDAWFRSRSPEQGSAVDGVRVPASACILGAAVAAIDETIQLFVPGRSGMLSDVLLDSSGVLCAVIILWGVSRLISSGRKGA